MLQWLQPQYWRERRQARVAYQEAFRRLEADFYSYVLAKPDVREILEVLHSEAIDLTVRTGRRFRLPPTLELLYKIVHDMRHDDMDSESSITAVMTSRLTARDNNRREAWILALWGAGGVLWLLFSAR